VIFVFFPHVVDVRLGSTTGTAAEMPGTAFLILAGSLGAIGFVHWLLTRPKVTLAFPKRRSKSSTPKN
jgi:hypothetical protein